MANHKSAKTRIVRNNKRSLINGARRSRVRTFVKKVDALINAKDKEQFPLIILSGMNFNDDITKGLSMGANQFLTKPVVMERLYTAVTEELTKKVQTGQ